VRVEKMEARGINKTQNKLKKEGKSKKVKNALLKLNKNKEKLN
jgi:hypothetical protein